MKKVVSGIVLQDKMNEAIDLLCNTVKNTLGPKGCNVIIDHSSFSPFITNDGVTIAENVESDDEVVNTILEIAKESSIKTNEYAGDGTTTTLVLLQGFYEEGLKLIKKGENPIVVKRKLDLLGQKLKKKIEKLAVIPKKLDLENIATIAGGSKDIGKMICEAYNLVKDKSGINILESNLLETKMVLKKGYVLDTGLVSFYYFNKMNEIVEENIKVILWNDVLTDLNSMASVINEIFKKRDSLVIIADDFAEELVEEVVSMFINEQLAIYLLKIPGYGKEKLNILNDLEVISQGIIYKNGDNFSFNNVGVINRITFKKEETILEFTNNKRIENLITDLENFDDEAIKKRKAMLNYGVVDILVGALTTVEKRELKMRFDDALEAIGKAKEGILPGSGLVFYKLANEIDDEINPFREVLKLPIKQILINAGLDEESILNYIKDSKFEKIFNVLTGEYELVNDTMVVDSLNVVINSLLNAISVAGMLLTTTSIVINEYQNNGNNLNIEEI